jgi:hypothetical protein
LKGRGFSRATPEACNTSGFVIVAAEKFAALKGHGFSRAVRAAKQRTALAAEGCFLLVSITIFETSSGD